MERKAFARAWRYLNFKPLAKWSALIAAIATGVFYLALLVVLLLFADLMVNRGKIPGFKELRPESQSNVLQSWEVMPPGDFYATVWNNPRSEEENKDRLIAMGMKDSQAEQLAKSDPNNLAQKDRDTVYQSYLGPLQKERNERLKAIGVEPSRAESLAKANRADLTEADADLIWRVQLYDLLSRRVGTGAADLIKVSRDPAPEEDLADHGVLSLVVRSRNHLVFGPFFGLVARLSPWMWSPRDQNAPFYLTGLLILALLLALLWAAALLLMNYLAAVSVIEACNRMRRAVYHHTFRLGTLAFKSLGPSEAVSIFTRQMESIHDGLYTTMTVVYREPVKFGLLVIFALLINWQLTLGFFILAILGWLVGGQILAYFRHQEGVASREAAEHLALLQESVMLMRLAKSYLMEPFNQRRVDAQLARHAASQTRRYWGEALYRPLLFFLGTAAALLLLYVAGIMVLKAHLRLAEAIALATALVSLYWPLVNLLAHRRALRRGREAAAVVFKFLDRPGEVGQAIGAEFLPPLSRQLELSKVSLKEVGTGRKLLDNVSLTVHAGQRVALVGPDEMEKHALVYLVSRFLDPTSGVIKIDGKDLRWVTFDSLRAQVATVLQNNMIFNDSVANNIGCGDPSFDLPKIIEASKIAHAHQFIQKLPHGYETVIGEMGHSLSVSEQFRIALARAIMRDPALMIVEEPTATLDDDTKALVDDTFNRVLPGRTVIFLPHRMSTIRSCDQVFLLNKGQVEAAGDHRELLSSNQLYRHLQYIEFNEFAEHA